MNDLQLAYWAGVFDFRGRIAMRYIHSNPTPYIILSSKKAEDLQPLIDAFRGRLRFDKNCGIGPGTYRWERTAFSAREIVTKLAPYMRTRQEVVAQVLAWRPKNRNKKRYTPIVFKPEPRMVQGSSMSGSPE